jgi:hypothetical protein
MLLHAFGQQSAGYEDVGAAFGFFIRRTVKAIVVQAAISSSGTGNWTPGAIPSVWPFIPEIIPL